VAITLVQKNGSVQTGTLAATPPAWSVATTAGNLLIIVCHEQVGTNLTWPTVPAGYTAVTGTPFAYESAGGAVGLFWKIAAGGDATPGNIGETSSTQNYETYTYEFASSAGWQSPPVDVLVKTAASTATATSKASGSTAALAQADELVFGIAALYTAGTALSFASTALALATPTTSSTKLWVGRTESAATTAQGTTASWTTAAASCIWVTTFKPNTGPVAPIKQPPQPGMTRAVAVASNR
jgi:hypothetical protein